MNHESNAENSSWSFVHFLHYALRSNEYKVQSTLDISKLMGLFFTSSNYPKCKLICTSDNFDL